MDFEHLITKKKLEDDYMFEDLVNPVSVHMRHTALFLMECSMPTLVDVVHLITKKKVEEDDVSEDLVNHMSVRMRHTAVQQAAMQHVHPGGRCAPHHRTSSPRRRGRRTMRLRTCSTP